MSKFAGIDALGKVYVSLLLVVFGLVIFQGLISVLGSYLPEFSLLIKSWKEILMGVALVISLTLLYQKRQFSIFKNTLILLIAGFALLHLALIPVFGGGLDQILAGILIDLRYLLFFVLVFAAVKLYPQVVDWFLKTGLAALLVIVGFGVLQVFILPHDFLKYFGYNLETIAPYLTVDKNYDFIRISSFLRGPNPLGAYSVLGLTMIGAYWARYRPAGKKLALVLVAVAGCLISIWFSYSRSALVAAVVALAILAVLLYGRKLNIWAWVSTLGAFIIALAIGWLARDSYFVSNVLLHEDPVGGSSISSNQGHVDSLVYGLERMAAQPWGAGIGSTGSASLLGEQTVIIENQYLFIAHEVGWPGLVIFLVIFGWVLWLLWRRKSNWLATAVLASGVGLAIVGLVLPVWVDDTVAIVWWGLAGLAIAARQGVEYLEDGRRKQKSKNV